MGSFLSKSNKSLLDMGSSHPKRILMLGLDAAGKTTILYKLKLQENVTTIPTIGFNVEEVKVGKGLTFTIWDIGGQEKIRPLWKHYFTHCQGVVFVIDSADAARITEARDELFSFIDSDELINVPVVIIANKQDIHYAMKPSEIVEKMALNRLSVNHKWHLSGCCATSGIGLYEAMNQLGKLSKEYVKSLKKT